MKTHSPANERIKRDYYALLKEAKAHSEPTVDAVAKALARFEAFTGFRDFKSFHHQQAVAFKKRLSEQIGQASGARLSKATQYATLAHLKRFFQWLAWRPGYKSYLHYSDAEYFNLSGKDARVATARRERASPTVGQVKRVIELMPSATDIERRNRAIVAFTLLTGARDGAIVSMKMKHIHLDSASICQDARDVHTKFSKTFTTYFFPVGDEIQQIVADWVRFLQREKGWGSDDPLFPATRVAVDANRHFFAAGLKREHWSSARAIRDIFRQAFGAANEKYFNPHSLRNTLVRLGQTVCQTAEEYKAWSQNLGHEGVLTTFRSYGEVESGRQAEIIRSLAHAEHSTARDVDQIARAIMRMSRLPSGTE